MFGAQGKLKRHEQVLLDAVVAAAPPELRSMLEAQVREIRWVQRLVGSPEVNFYAKKRAAGGWERDSLLPNRAEVRVATATLLVDSHRHACALDAVLGHLFALTIRPPVRIRTASTLSVADVQVVDPDAVLNRDAPGSAAALAPASFSQSSRGDATALPVGWSILDPQEMYVVGLPENDAVALATGSDGRLLLGWKDGAEERFGLFDPNAEGVVQLKARSFGSALGELA